VTPVTDLDRLHGHLAVHGHLVPLPARHTLWRYRARLRLRAAAWWATRLIRKDRR
jgi:hypothetical protein